MKKFQRINFTSSTKYEELRIDFGVNEIYVDKSSIGKDEKEKLNFNFLAVGRSNNEAKKLISALSNHRYFLTTHNNGISLFKKLSNAKDFLHNFNNKLIKVWNETFYILEEPVEKDLSEPRLLVVFSSIADLAFNASIDRRMFFKNFPKVSKYIPKNTYVLRIADIGGVLGSFYLNSNADMNFEKKIEDLISKIRLEKSISDRHTALYGTSKGATGALYHGIKMGLNTLAVDPIISDVHYLEKFNDLHFVKDVFPESKQEKFTKLFSDNMNKDLSHIKLVTSPNSEQFEYISELILIPKVKLCSYIFSNPNIKGHTDMGEHTLNFVTAMLNNMLYGIHIQDGFSTTY